jgi:putative heme iron utilization protein
MNKKVNIAIIGHKFMGRAHSNGWKQASNFFNLEAEPILKIACGRNEN